MYVVAQRVTPDGSTTDGINTFLHLHPSANWQTPPSNILQTDPGQLVRHWLEVPPGMNRVRSYFDVVTADTKSWGAVRIGMMSFVANNRLKPFPWSGEAHNSYFQLGMDGSLAKEWHRELAALYRATQAIVLAHRPAS